MLSVKNISGLTQINYLLFTQRLVPITKLFYKFCNSDDQSEHKYLLNKLFKSLNINITVINKEKYYYGKKVIIPNHSSSLDGVIVYALTGCGFLSKKIKSSFAHFLFKKMNILYIDRKLKNNNHVKQISDFIKKKQALCIFPEGTTSRENTLMRFRTGAFYTGYPVQPFILKYNCYVEGDNFKDDFLKLLSQKQIDVEVTIMDIEHGPFDTNSIENIRYKMAKTGNLLLSRVSNRDIKD